MKNRNIKNIKLYPKNSKNKIITIVLIGTIITTSLTGCTKNKTCNIKEDHYHIYKSKDEIKYIYEGCNFDSTSYINTKEYIIKDDLGNYLYQNNLYETDNIKEDIQNQLNTQTTIYQIKTSEPYKNKKGTLTFPTKWKVVNETTFSNYEGIGRIGTQIKYKTYKIEKENNEYEKEEIITSSLKDQTYIDINDFVVLEDAKQAYYVKGKKMK